MPEINLNPDLSVERIIGGEMTPEQLKQCVIATYEKHPKLIDKWEFDSDDKVIKFLSKKWLIIPDLSSVYMLYRMLEVLIKNEIEFTITSLFRENNPDEAMDYETWMELLWDDWCAPEDNIQEAVVRAYFKMLGVELEEV